MAQKVILTYVIGILLLPVIMVLPVLPVVGATTVYTVYTVGMGIVPYQPVAEVVPRSARAVLAR